VFILLTISIAVAAGAQTPPGASLPTKPDNYYAAGNQVDVSRPMAGDVIVAGRQVEITQAVAGDILAAGWRVSLSGRADDDVRMAGAEVTVNAPVDGDLTLAGGDVRVGSQTHVTGRSWMSGNHVRVDGVLDRELQIAGGTVQIGGEIRKPVRVIAENLEVLPTARILAPLSYKSPQQARILEGATIAGPVTFDRIQPREAREARSFAAVSSVLFAFHLATAGLLLLWLVPQFMARAVDTLRTTPGRSVLLGFALLITVPIAALILIVSVLALPIGMTLGALYLIGLLLGVLTIALYVGEAEARFFKRPPMTFGSRAMWLLAGVMSLAILRAVPVVGTLVVVASVLFGFGALTLAAYRAYWTMQGPAAA
jgi:hypothetical protein